MNYSILRMVGRGALVILEGCDHSGKTTQARKLVETLNKQGVKAKGMSFPDRSTASGALINDYLKGTTNLDDHCIHLLYSANRWEAVGEMKRLLAEGTTLIVDRYAYSGVAFTAAKPGMSLSWCKQPDVGLPRPDLVLFLDVSVACVAARGDFGGERYERPEFQKKVLSVYEQLHEDNWKRVDADKSIDEVHSELLDVITTLVKQVGSKDIQQLWCDTQPLTNGST